MMNGLLTYGSVVAPLICLRDRYYHARCAAKTKPLIMQRLRHMDDDEKFARPVSIMVCNLDICAKKGRMTSSLGPSRMRGPTWMSQLGTSGHQAFLLRGSA